MGLSNYMVDNQSPSYAPDQELAWALTSVMFLVLICAFLIIALMVPLDITLQLVRLYYRFIVRRPLAQGSQQHSSPAHALQAS